MQNETERNTQGLLRLINGPSDLKRLSVDQLRSLAKEVRELIVQAVSTNGGHLASNLGTVELTLALHYVFDFACDQLIWDVGHQCYTHKIITGRKDGLRHLRHPGGVSGFPDPSEGPYDRFLVGHAGTAIPTAIGLALADQIHRSRRQGPSPRIVVLVGDASIFNGTSFEGLNNLGMVRRQLLIVLNDNSMAIDPTVGALARCFARLRLSQTYDDLRRSTAAILEHLPGIGRSVEEAMERLKKHIRMVMPGSQIFESLNIPYFGPVDGHDIGSLVELFNGLRHIEHPVILHAYTRKGCGFAPADNGPSRFHSTGPFVITDDGVIEDKPSQTGRTFTDVFGEAAVELAQRDERVVAITAAMCEGTGLRQFRTRFPDRFFDVGIAEEAAVDLAAGLAAGGLRPLVCIYSTFFQRSMDQVFQEVALQDLPVIFCLDRAGFVGPDGPTHHGLMDIGLYRMMPNMILCAPANAREVRLALEFAVRQGHPVLIRYPKDLAKEGPEQQEDWCVPFELGKAVVVRDVDRADLVLVGYGPLVYEALRASEVLASMGIEVGVINARFASPLDDRLVRLLDSGKRMIVVEDHLLPCGFGSALLERAVDTACKARMDAIRILAAPRVPFRHDTRAAQLIKAGLTADQIVRQARQMLALPMTV
ncbi:MAG: 1-deoxy-D-xylulose-5-phosphate synthase [Sedimentisphaerales bacterium]|nr:1-deoxy-D-xylulose-5-phosphate synthase [Sedimentisphaerales bacterium]